MPSWYVGNDSVPVYWGRGGKLTQEVEDIPKFKWTYTRILHFYTYDTFAHMTVSDNFKDYSSRALYFDRVFNGTSTRKGQLVPTAGRETTAQAAKDGQRDKIPYATQ